MKANDLRKKYLQFFEQKGHKIIPGSSLIPENDPTVLFTTAGMHPLVPYLLGEKHAGGKRLVDVQKCIRTGDIDEVGDNRHLTFFEMLGNWSLGDYFKKEAIEWSYEFLISEKWLSIDSRKLSVTVFGGDERVQSLLRDDEAAKIWQEIGIPGHKIAYMPGGVFESKDNWWGPAGQTGPCGPSTEMFYWVGKGEFPPENSNVLTDPDNWLEIWNDVFMGYNKTGDGKYGPLSQKNVDTGMGLERTLAILNGKDSVYETDLFLPIIKKIEELSSLKYKENEKLYRIIADHIKASIFLISEGVVPSNVGQGYILRRLIRRQIRSGHALTMDNKYRELVDVVEGIYSETYPKIKDKKEFIITELEKEFNKFILTLEKSLKDGVFNSIPAHITGKWLFNIYQTFGFPSELALEEIRRVLGRSLDEADTKRIMGEFEEENKKHQKLSRTASAGMFKGGLADASLETTKLHTAAHLLLASLRVVLGEHVFQKGSNITKDRLRFDFSHPKKMTREEITKVEDLVNEKIKENLKIEAREMILEEAKKENAMGVFESKYGDKVKVYSIGDFSKEICGGPHVNLTSELNRFKISKEEACSSGVRRIKAVLE